MISYSTLYENSFITGSLFLELAWVVSYLIVNP